MRDVCPRFKFQRNPDKAGFPSVFRALTDKSVVWYAFPVQPTHCISCPVDLLRACRALSMFSHCLQLISMSGMNEFDVGVQSMKTLN